MAKPSMVKISMIAIVLCGIAGSIYCSVSVPKIFNTALWEVGDPPIFRSVRATQDINEWDYFTPQNIELKYLKTENTPQDACNTLAPFLERRAKVRIRKGEILSRFHVNQQDRLKWTIHDEHEYTEKLPNLEKPFVIYAAFDVPAGEKIPADALAYKSLAPTCDVRSEFSAVDDPRLIVGKTATRCLSQGEIITTNQVK